MITIQIVRYDQIVAHHNSLNLIKILFDQEGFTVVTTRGKVHYPFAHGYKIRTL